MQNARFILSKTQVINQYNKALALADMVSYSSKTNQDVTKILEQNTDAFFSVHLENELKHVKDHSRVMFLAQGWTLDYIQHLVDLGIRYFIVDNETDLDTLLNFLNDNDITLNVLLRMKLKEMSIRTERYFVFGMRAETINRRIPKLRKNNKINILGVHFHRKTQNMSEWNLKYELSNSLSEEVMQSIDMLNIGGGLPAEYANTNVNVFDSITKKLAELKDWLHDNNIKMVVEPGRFIAAPSCKLETTVIGVHENNIIVNASVYNSDMDAILVPVKLLVEGEQEDGEAFIIKGITPCSMDLFRYRVYIKKTKVGDKLVFINAGAYNFTSDFCDLEKLETVVE